MDRRYDIDWLRVISIGLLLIYHIAIVFQPWALEYSFIRSDESLEWLWILMAIFNVWRIPLLFVVSGMGVYFAIGRRSWRGLAIERARRILLPFLFGVFFIVPLHYFIFQFYYGEALTYIPDMGHLWFLGNIFIYAIFLSPLLFYCRGRSGGRFLTMMRLWLTSRWGIYLLVVPFVLEGFFVVSGSYEDYAYTAHGFWLGAVAFLIGACVIALGSPFYIILRERWRLHFGVAFILYLVRLLIFELEGVPVILVSLESVLWIFSLLGFGYARLNCPSSALFYLRGAAYPVYIIHMLFLYLASYFILPLDIFTMGKLFLIIFLTFAGCFFSYHFLIARISFIGVFFGLRGAG
ncbi:MAG: acyltransferase family protein [Alphaproteobacteria bacterium]